MILLVFFIALLLLNYQFYRLRPEALLLERAEHTVAAMSEAKQLLIARAVQDKDRPGSLPCPDADANGSADLFAGNDCPKYLGRFPWRTLASGKLTDAQGELLWYALSRNYRDDDSAQPIHINLAAQLQADSVDDVVAVILAPGHALPGQTGRPGNQAQDYLEAENSDGDQIFAAHASWTGNDRIALITRTELMQAVARMIVKRLAGDADSGLLAYRSSMGTFPAPDVDGDGYPDTGHAHGKVPFLALNYPESIQQMLTLNDWFALADYAVGNQAQTAELSLHEHVLTLP